MLSPWRIDDLGTFQRGGEAMPWWWYAAIAAFVALLVFYFWNKKRQAG
ncbi:MAG TPA: hypothetical protein VGM03_12110 [Phycisphaerae bacterium]|jgi:hypothetical protein